MTVYNSVFMDNFALNSGVFKIFNGGTLQVYDSLLENNNAIEGNILSPNVYQSR